MTGHPNYTASALEDMRCDIVEANERAQAREARREARQRKAEQEHEEEAAISATYAQRRRLAAIRQNPKYPELGATTRESQTICRNEVGQWVDQGQTVGCKIGGVPVFACLVDEGQTTKCTHWKEAAEVADERDDMIANHGQPESQSVSSDGFRTFSWASGNIVVAGYEHGVKITVSKPIE